MITRRAECVVLLLVLFLIILAAVVIVYVAGDQTIAQPPQFSPDFLGSPQQK